MFGKNDFSAGNESDKIEIIIENIAPPNVIPITSHFLCNKTASKSIKLISSSSIFFFFVHKVLRDICENLLM